jgi:hypothetical protein
MTLYPITEIQSPLLLRDEPVAVDEEAYGWLDRRPKEIATFPDMRGLVNARRIHGQR